MKAQGGAGTGGTAQASWGHAPRPGDPRQPQRTVPRANTHHEQDVGSGNLAAKFNIKECHFQFIDRGFLG